MHQETQRQDLANCAATRVHDQAANPKSLKSQQPMKYLQLANVHRDLNSYEEGEH